MAFVLIDLYLFLQDTNFCLMRSVGFLINFRYKKTVVQLSSIHFEAYVIGYFVEHSENNDRYVDMLKSCDERLIRHIIPILIQTPSDSQSVNLTQ